MKINAIILAAGSSSRMGQSKQLLPWGNESLLRHAVNTALQSGVNTVFVVLGSNADAHRNEIKDLDVTIVVNNEWQRGMGSSLKAGLHQALNGADGIMLMVCDQPLISSSHLVALINNFKDAESKIVASRYQDAVGVPAVFSKDMIGELMNIPDDQGARSVIAAHLSQTSFIELASGTDVDTPDDYARLIQPKR